MKVEIAPGFEDDLRRIEWHLRWDKYLPKTWYREIKYFIQRGRRGYSDRDLWNLDLLIAKQVLAFLDSPRSGLQFWGGDFSKSDEYHEKQDARVEAEIRWLMEQAMEGWISDDWLDPEYRKRINRANQLFGKHWWSLWD